MIKLRMTILTILATLMLSMSNTYAQDGKSSTEALDGPLTDLYVVLGAGAAGAVLGLSTLSFVDQPTKKFKNVSMGAALGIIAGVGIVVYNQATRASSEIYSSEAINELNPNRFESIARQEFADISLFDSYRQSELVNFQTTF